MRKLGEIANLLNLPYRGDQNKIVSGIKPVYSAKTDDLSFVVGTKFESFLNTSEAGCLILNEAHSKVWKGNALITNHPYLAFANASKLFRTEDYRKDERHTTATVASSAKIGKDCTIGGYSTICPDTVLGEGTNVGSYCYIGKNVTIGKNCDLSPYVFIADGSEIGDDCTIGPHSKIGMDGFGFAQDNQGRSHKIHDLAKVKIGDRVYMGADAKVAKGTLKDTVIGQDCIFDACVHIAHGAVVGKSCIFSLGAGVGGSSEVGDNCILHAHVLVTNDVEIASGTRIRPCGFVTKSLPKGDYTSTLPLYPKTKWYRIMARLFGRR